MATRDTTSREFHLASSLHVYKDTKNKPFIHLFDGGISDNLGLRGPMESTVRRGGFAQSLKQKGREETKRVAIVVVNAQTSTPEHWALVDLAPGLAQMIDGASTIMINHYNFETLALLKEYLENWRRETKGNVTFYVVDVSFHAIEDAAKRRHFSRLPTSLGLPREEVDGLRTVAKEILLASPEFRRFLTDLGGEPVGFGTSLK